LTLQSAEFDKTTREGEVTVRFASELISAARDSAGQVVEGNPKELRRQRDVWTFSRIMGSNDPNWQLVATGE
ncbi:MAG: Tim44/TimA family putative adaptor protein, partial [Paracoccaceae bacterium]|nr:Tim44/TimA family putative adaptor protein [Paracoccaceae bacterium]